MMEALELLKLILATMKVNIEEQIRWFNQIIDETGMYYVLKDFVLPTK
jgi:[acyl-carrier-protein] S-malonyltransferase